MIVEKCPCCGGKIIKPDPPARTQEENIAFRKWWDAEYERKNDARVFGQRVS